MKDADAGIGHDEIVFGVRSVIEVLSINDISYNPVSPWSNTGSKRNRKARLLPINLLSKIKDSEAINDPPKSRLA